MVLDDHEWILNKVIHRVEDEIDDRANRRDHTRFGGHHDDIVVLLPMDTSSYRFPKLRAVYHDTSDYQRRRDNIKGEIDHNKDAIGFGHCVHRLGHIYCIHKQIDRRRNDDKEHTAWDGDQPSCVFHVSEQDHTAPKLRRGMSASAKQLEMI